MQDMYSFDLDLPSAQKTYEEVAQAYQSIFERVQLKVLKASASSGDMGGSQSHEFHLALPIGEDTIMHCSICNASFNSECSGCGHADAHQALQGIELGHVFLLGTRYTKALGACIKDRDGCMAPLEMGCFGIGVSRLMAAIAEVHHDEEGLAWPASVAPFDLILTGGQSIDTGRLLKFRAHLLTRDPSLSIAIDDRADLSVSWRIKDARLIGAPACIVLGRQFEQTGKPEIHFRGDNGVDDKLGSSLL